jgi:1-phosphofructokinase family hexose kinase
MILSVTLNPCIDRTLFVDGLKPYDTNRVVRSETDAGGKGINLSRVAVELGGESLATGFLGGGAGAHVRRVLDVQGVQHEFVEIEGNTRINFSVEDGSGEPPTTFNSKGPSVSATEWDRLFALVTKHTQSSDWITLGGSLPKGVPVEAYFEIGKVVKQAGKRLALDADGEAMRRGLDAKPHFIKPNRKEAGRLLGRSVESVDDAVFAAEELRQYLEPDGVCVLSLGQDGAVLASAAGTLIGRPIEVESVSTIGSGDSLVGAMLTALERGSSLEDSFRLGLAAGAATAMTDGAEIARRPVVESLLPRAVVESAH